ncbi:MAG: hypothetical protein COU08_01055 [Candidatus Harrisonbacteria bacterium CG10_big_fil_rev_8_21_14_0_10_42_17]|uniref:DNA polymerase III delta N-terminal domain-containing protein n=1 Tax=Candidatus Harrisonbacteria bacterium CG10_big_fil_rev_8_21_14_0_10_42_17 TaxID=1974584 RepID=A0A2M6WIW4_9BACT|nr:MAG: hypothetical protein COU08_01055 [Candidatus Harrisonbacteria bacterium CG10_big_fil_rev_8_21_14_0_10_42_17]
MIVYLYGPDTFRKRAKVQELVDAYKKKHSSLGVRSYDFSLRKKSTDTPLLQDIISFLENASLFDSSKLILISGIQSTDGDVARILKPLLKDAVVTIILQAEKKLGKNFAWLTGAKSQSFEFLRGAEYISWIQLYARECGFEMRRSDAASLSILYDKDTWGASSEIQKYALGAIFKNDTVPAPAFFPLVQTLKGATSFSRKLVALGYLLASEDAAAIFNILASLQPPEQKVLMAAYDAAIKSGKLEYSEALFDIVLSSS